MRAFFNWLYEKDYTECHRLEKVRPPKPREKEVEILSDEEIERMFASINPDTVLGAGNLAIFSLMLDTGLRLSEVVTLKHRDVHLDKRSASPRPPGYPDCIRISCGTPMPPGFC